MADGQILAIDAECAVQRAVLIALRSDVDVRTVFGHPARIYDDETRGPAYPFAVLERHETRPAGAAGVAALEHIISFGILSRYDGRKGAKEAIGVLRAAIERAELAPVGQVVVLAYPTYSDVFRTNDRQAFRGILRLRIISEGAV